MAVSFKLTGSSKPKELLKGAIEDQSSAPVVDNERDYVTSVARNKIQSTKPEDVKKEVIIPCQKDGFKVALEEAMKDKSDLEAAAISAVLKDADSFAGKEEEESAPKTLVIPGVETSQPSLDDDNKIARQVTVGDAADYDAVSIDDFGMAMLRGMGFIESEGIGKTNKQAVKPLEVHVRPKGQGLGAGMNRAKMMAASSSKKDEKDDFLDGEEIELRTGSKCVVLNGPHKEKYATVDGLDAENSRVIIRLAVGDKVLSMPESNVKAVNDREFQRYSRYINKASADQVRMETEKKLMEMRVPEQEREREDDKERGRDDKKSRKDGHHHHHHHKSRSRSRSVSRSRSRSSDRKQRHGGGKSSSTKRREEEIPRWLHPNLSVLIRSGKYADQQGSIGDVLTPTTCTIRLQSGKTLYDIEASQLIPVQPRRIGDAVMALTGENRRLVGEIVELDAGGRYAAVQSAADQMTVVSEKLSNLCIYTGSLDF